jgi:hypothetical protein
MGKMVMVAWCAFAALMAIAVVFMVREEFKDKTDPLKEWSDQVDKLRHDAYALGDTKLVELLDSILDDIQDQMNEREYAIHQKTTKSR